MPAVPSRFPLRFFDFQEASSSNQSTYALTPADSEIAQVKRQQVERLPQTQVVFVDNNDKKAARRIRNTKASHKYRENKVERIRELERKVAECEKERDEWRKRAEDLSLKQEAQPLHGAIRGFLRF